MRLVFFVLLVLLIAQIGFWNTLGAVIGAALMFVLLALILMAAVVIGGIVLASSIR